MPGGSRKSTVKPRSNDLHRGGEIGFSRKRVGRDGKPRYTAYYVDARGRERSAGTFATKKKANEEWRKAEAKLAEGRLGDPARGRQRFGDYVRLTWLPNHVIQVTTRQNYTYYLESRILPEFEDMRIADILPSHVREWITKLPEDGVSSATIQHCKTLLSAIFTTALNDQVTYLHPGKGVKTPVVAVKSRLIITAQQFDTIYHALPDNQLRLVIGGRLMQQRGDLLMVTYRGQQHQPPSRTQRHASTAIHPPTPTAPPPYGPFPEPATAGA